MPSSPQTLEFRLPVPIPIEWFDHGARLWNEANSYLRWLQHYRRVVVCNAIDLPPVEIKIRKHEWKDRQGKDQADWVLCCDISRQFRIDRTKSWDKDNIEERPVVSLVNPQWRSEPPIADFSAIALRKPFAQKRCPWLQESSLPQIYANDFIGLVVIPAWEAYQKGQRGKPRFKGKGDRIDTLPSESFRAQCRFRGGDRLVLPGLGEVEIPGLEARLVRPLEKMAAEMQADPEKYPRLQEKLQKLRELERSKLVKADGSSMKELKKLPDPELSERLREYDDRIADAELMETAIAYFSKPGAFRLLRRDDKSYLQISCEMPVKVRKTSRSVSVDTGLDLLVHSTSGLKVKHQDFSVQEGRIDQLKAKRSAMTYGSNNYQRISKKIRRLEGKIKRSRRGHQAYWGQQIAKVNDTIEIRQINIKELIEVPIPRPDKEGETYLPNGRGDSQNENRTLLGKALGQFCSIVEQQAKKHGRKFGRTTVEVEASDSSPLEVSPESDRMQPAGCVPPLEAQSLATDAREGELVTTSTTGGNVSHEATAQRSSKNSPPKKEAPEFVSQANPPEPRKRQQRNRKRERAIG